MNRRNASFPQVSCLFCLLLLALTSCDTLQHRISKNQGYFGQLPPDRQHSIRAGTIRVGFSSREVYLAWGQPNHTVATESAAGSGETWVYTRIITDVEHHNVYRKNPATGAWLPAYEPVYIDREYIEKSVTLINGQVSSWTEYSRMLPFRTYPRPY